jgi:CHAT domain-containing protein
VERRPDEAPDNPLSAPRRTVGEPVPPGPGCPSPQEWGLYEAGLYPNVKAESMLEHAADCPACGTLLADLRGSEFGGAQAGQGTDDSKTMVVLRSNTAEWKRDMLARIAQTLGNEARPSRVRFSLPRFSLPGFSLPRYSWAAAAAVVAVAAGAWWISSRNTPEAAFRLMAQAYAEQRPFELRIPGADHAPLRAERGAAASPVLPLLDAQRLIASKLEQRPDDADWLRANARAELLQWRYASAIELLRRAEDTEPNNSTILGDLGIAYLQRAEMESRPQDIAQAIEYLTTALKASPSDPVLRFNRALAYERQPAPRMALEDWNELLRLEPSGGWADEAREHVKRLKGMIDQQAGRAQTPQSSEDAITALAAVGFRSTPSLDAAAVAADLAQKHGDPWMQRFLAASRSAGSQAGTDLLESAAKAYSAGESSQGEARAGEAVKAFRKARNEPGVIFASFEQAYGLQRLSQPQPCLAAARAALPGAHGSGYLWLEAQLQLTSAACLQMQNHTDRAYQAMLNAQERAEEAGFESLVLRSIVFRAELLRKLGSYREAVKLDAEGLRRYWSGEGTITQAYQFYYDAGMSTAGLQHPRAAAALLNEAVQVAALRPDRFVEVIARSRYADVLVENGQLADASLQFDRSEQELSGIPESPASLLYGSYAELSRARLEGQQSQVGRGLERLNRMESKLASIQNPTVEALLWRVKSELLTSAGRTEESEDPLRRILALAVSARANSPDASDPTAVAREVSHAVNILADRSLQRGDAADAWRIWTTYNPCFRTISSASAGSARLLYVDLPSGPVVWISDASGIRAVRLPVSSDRLQRLALSFRRALANRAEPIDHIRALARQLYVYTFAPIENQLDPDKILYIAADGPFASIPFAALVSQDGRWLADRHRVVYSPPLAGASESPPGGLPTKPHVVAAGYGKASQVFQTLLPSIPDVESDLRAVAAALPDHTLLQNGDATVSNLLNALPSAGIFHFSGHAIVTAGDAALVLASGKPAPGKVDDSDRLLWASKIPSQSLRNCRLVMLAACSTGRAASEDNDPSSAMARAFLLTGVPEVIASRWDVDSRATSILVESFYRSVAGGASTEEALSSSIHQLRETPAFAHPFYWAAFDLFRS